MFSGIKTKNKKKKERKKKQKKNGVSVAEIGQSNRLKFYVDPSKIYVVFGFKSVQMTYSL